MSPQHHKTRTRIIEFPAEEETHRREAEEDA